MMHTIKGRDKEATIIRQANRAAAVGRLMLRELKDWYEFFEADRLDLINLPRRQLKSGSKDVKSRLSPEIKKFCKRNFIGMTEQKLSQLYEEIKAKRGLELPLKEFEERFAKILPDIIEGFPPHLTVTFSLWGMNYKYPEDELSKDVLESIEQAQYSTEKLQNYKGKKHTELKEHQEEIGKLKRQELFAARSAILSCFNLLEAYLNGIAWDYLNKGQNTILSNRQFKLLNDSSSASIRDKLLKYPEIISGKSLWKENDKQLEEFIEKVKRLRDSVVHPSPFNAPQKFGGYDKLLYLYRIDYDTALTSVDITLKLIKQIHKHINGEKKFCPIWISDFCSKYEMLTN